MKRYKDWRKRLKQHIRGAANLPFAYGRHDCALFAAGAVKVMTGKDIARGLRGYRTAKAGLKKVRSKGFETHVDPFAKVLPQTTMRAAQDGDLAIISGPLGESVGIVQGKFVLGAGEDFGVRQVPIEQATRFLQVGD